MLAPSTFHVGLRPKSARYIDSLSGGPAFGALTRSPPASTARSICRSHKQVIKARGKDTESNGDAISHKACEAVSPRPLNSPPDSDRDGEPTRRQMLAVMNGLFLAAPLSSPAVAWASTGALESQKNPSRISAYVRFIADVEKRGGGMPVGDFERDLPWLNTSGPLSFTSNLRGRVVLLDFWTYCCINCMHVLPELAALERKYEGSPVTVVGVHSAKFSNEKDSDAVRQAVIRYGVEHPVVNDGGMTLWRKLGVQSWPTLVLVSPNGQVLARLSGEGHQEDLDMLIEAALQYYGDAGQLRDAPLPLALERDKDASGGLQSALRYPGKIATDLEGKRLFIADTANHRIVVTDLEGKFITQAGAGGAAGLVDGPLERAMFSSPQGLGYSAAEDALYVADTENHALRKVDLQQGLVYTLAGNGTKGRDYVGGRRAPDQALNSPWDISVDDANQMVYVAMAGQHQIWRFDMQKGTSEAFSGDGYERNLNGSTGASSSWAQPSGLALGPAGRHALFVADSESSSIRQLDLRSGGSQLLVGGDPIYSDNLFRFGDVDGDGGTVRLQHPLAVLAHSDNKKLYVADSYNHKVKVVEMGTGASHVATVAGTGVAGCRDGPTGRSQVSEPGGLAQGPGGLVYIADTNNSLIRAMDPVTGALSTLDLSSVPPPAPAGMQGAEGAGSEAGGAPAGAEVVRVVAPVGGPAGEVQLAIRLPPGYHYTRGADSRFEASVEPAGARVVLEPAAGSLRTTGGVAARIQFKQTADSLPPGTQLRVNGKIYYCQDESVCLYQQVSFEIPLSRETNDTESTARIIYDVPVKAPTNDSALFF